MRSTLSVISGLAVLALAACTAAPASTAPAPIQVAAPPADTASPAPLTVLVSIDGFRPDYLTRGETPVLNQLAATGARGALQPSFPSKTFPNHYTLVTGLTPDHNGIVNNTMEDARRPGDVFTLSNPSVTSDPIWWEEATPIWVSAEQQGIRSATMFWPGSDFEIHGTRPATFAPFDQKLTDFGRVDMLLSWLDAPEAERPQFATLYFDTVDTAGHLYGPQSPKTASALAQVDAALGRFIAGLEARGLRESTNLVIVSDHGMAPISDEQIMSLDAMIAPEKVHTVWTGTFAGLSPLPGHETEVRAALIGAHPHGECWAKENLPERFAYGANPRVPAIICLAENGWRYETAEIPAWRGAGGDHGYDPADANMAALFIANGPDIEPGTDLGTFHNTSVYPLLAALTGVEPVQGDGDIADVEAALR